MPPKLEIYYMPLDEALKIRWLDNPKLHDIGVLVESIQKYGFRDAPILDMTLGMFVAGNGRLEALDWIRKLSPGDPPRGIYIDKSGNWFVPVQKGIDARSVLEAEAFALDHNNTTMSGGDFTAIDMAGMWGEGYLSTLANLATQNENVVTVDRDDIDALLKARNKQADGKIENENGQKLKVKRITILIENEDAAEDVLAAVQKLLSKNPNWSARVK